MDPKRRQTGAWAMTSATVQPRDIAWGRALLAGAVLGGFGWALFAADVLGSPGDQFHIGTIIEPRMIVAGIVSMVCVLIAAILIALGSTAAPARSRVLLSAAVAFVVAILSGWIVLGLAVVQLTVSGAW
jgi:hypothetical protein